MWPAFAAFVTKVFRAYTVHCTIRILTSIGGHNSDRPIDRSRLSENVLPNDIQLVQKQVLNIAYIK